MEVFVIESNHPMVADLSFHSGVIFTQNPMVVQIQVSSEEFAHIPLKSCLCDLEKLGSEGAFAVINALLSKLTIQRKVNLKSSLESAIKESQKILHVEFELQRKALEARAREIGVDFQSTASYPSSLSK